MTGRDTPVGFGISPRAGAVNRRTTRPSPHGRSSSPMSAPPVRSVETWFGSPDRPLFGSVHMPASGRARGAVVVCPPLAKEHITTYRGLRQLAHLLAAAGFLVLRFDYRGQGDSAGTESAPDAVEGWQDSVRSAVAYVRSAGATDVSLVGVRAGAVLASSVLADLGPLTSIAFLDPVLAGRRYVRQQQAQYTVSIGEDDPSDPRVSFVGAALAPEAVRALSGLGVDAAAVTESASRVLAVLRETDADVKPVTSFLTAADPDVLWTDRLESFVEPPSFVFSVPTGVITDVAAWIVAGPESPRTAVSPLVRTTARVAETSMGESIFETIDYLGDHRLLSIRTFTESCDDADRLVVLHPMASEHRIGPARSWVGAALDLAEIGVPTLRFDRRGVGDGGPVSIDESTAPTSQASREDVSAMMSSLGVAPRRSMHAGVCSGAWHSAYAAEQHGAATVVLMNMVKWSFRNAGVPIRAAHVDAMDSRTADRLFVVARRVRNTLRRVGESLPDPVWTTLGKFGVVSAPEVVLRPLAARGTRVVTMLSPEDRDWFLNHRGDRALGRVRAAGAGGVEVSTFDHGDHALLHRDLRDAMLRRVVDTAAETYRLPPTHRTAAAPVRSETL